MSDETSQRIAGVLRQWIADHDDAEPIYLGRTVPTVWLLDQLHDLAENAPGAAKGQAIYKHAIDDVRDLLVTVAHRDITR